MNSLNQKIKYEKKSCIVEVIAQGLGIGDLDRIHSSVDKVKTNIDQSTIGW